MDDEISSEDLAALLGDAAPSHLSTGPLPPGPLLADGEGERSQGGAGGGTIAGAGPHLDDEISADELAALGFASPPANAPSPSEMGRGSGGKVPVQRRDGATPRLPELTAQDDVAPDAGISLLMDVPLRVSIELGRISMTLQQVLGLGRGSIIELERLAGEPVDILVNDKLIGRGEVVVIDEYFGVKITELIEPKG
jgi:flagellar motor switch protein FliN/FliY